MGNALSVLILQCLENGSCWAFLGWYVYLQQGWRGTFVLRSSPGSQFCHTTHDKLFTVSPSHMNNSKCTAFAPINVSGLAQSWEGSVRLISQLGKEGDSSWKCLIFLLKWCKSQVLLQPFVTAQGLKALLPVGGYVWVDAAPFTCMYLQQELCRVVQAARRDCMTMEEQK